MKPHAGFCTTINGECVKLLYVRSESGERQVWAAQRIFAVKDQYIDVKLRAGELLRPLHGARV